MDTASYILFEDENLVVLNKPAGLLTIPDHHNDALPSLYAILKNKYGKIYIVHRLDKHTSGVILFAKNEMAHRFLSQQFELRRVQKFYLGIVNGKLISTRGTIDFPIMENPSNRGKMIISKKGKPALTDYEVQEHLGLYTLLKLQLHTGRTHQIRVHLQAIGHPIAVDELYGNGEAVYLSAIKRNYKLSRKEEAERPLLHRLALHAHQLIFEGPEGRQYNFIAPLPKDFQAVLNQLRRQYPQE